MKSFLRACMGRFSSASLRTKLIGLIAGVSVLIVGVSMTISLVLEVKMFRSRLIDEYQTTTHMLASNLEAAVAFGDTRDAADLLGNLEFFEHVISAKVFLADGSVLASFQSKNIGEKQLGSRLGFANVSKEGAFLLNSSVQVDDKVVGEVVLEASLQEVDDFLIKKVWVFLGLLTVSVILVVPLAILLVNMIAKPVVDLAATARRITKDSDFSTRHTRQRNDETGDLVDAFNEMMAAIEKRDDQIRSSEERFRGYFDLGIVGAGILDTKLVWKEANARWLEMIGCELDELIGHSFLEFLDIPSSQVTIDHFDIIGESTDQIKVGEYWFKQKVGSSIYVMMSMRLVPGTTHTPEHILFLAQDITDRKIYEEEMRMARDEAEASSRAKDEFLSIMSHELRTPLNPILGYVNMILSDSNEVENPIRLNYIRQSAEHLLGLIDNLLDYSRLERGTITCVREEVQLSSVCGDVVGLLKEGAISKGLDLEYVEEWNREYRVRELNALTDSVRLRQVLFNVVSNAIKFTDKGSVRVFSKLEPLGDGRALFRVEVMDTGVGIESKDFERVFRPFSQVDGSMSREYSGMGLGMAISQKIMTALGGSIGFSSSIGEGTTFWIEMELDVCENVKVESSDRGEGDWLLRLSPSNESILLVEDDMLNRELARSLIESSGYRVVCAKDGMEALEEVKAEDFDLIILDVRMPRLNGFETAKVIRKLERGKGRVPIVAMSAHVSSEVRAQCSESGMDDYLSKPLDRKKLKAMIYKWLVNRKDDEEVSS